MKILLVSNYLGDEQLSMLGFAGVLARDMPSADMQVETIAPAFRIGSSPLLPKSCKKWAGYVDKYVLFPRLLRKAVERSDVVHILDQGNAMYVKNVASKPNLVTCHDLLAVRAARGEIPGWDTSSSGKTYQALILRGLREAKYLVCVSEATKAEALRIVGTSENAVKVIYHGLFYPFTSTAGTSGQRKCLEELGLAVPFVLHVGGNQPYKNRVGAVQIFRKLKVRLGQHDLQLLLVGKSADEGLAQHLSEDVKVVSGLSNEQLCHVYSGAQALIFPSTNEGFGLPIIEAQACGCPVFTSNRAPMTEVGRGGARYFDPADPEEAAGEIADSWPEKAKMREAGLANASSFTTDRMVEGYRSYYRELVG